MWLYRFRQLLVLAEVVSKESVVRQALPTSTVHIFDYPKCCTDRIELSIDQTLRQLTWSYIISVSKNRVPTYEVPWTVKSLETL